MNIQMCLLSGVTIMMEIFDSSKITFAGIAMEASWVVSYMLLAVVAYALQQWRHLQMCTGLLSVIWVIYVW